MQVLSALKYYEDYINDSLGNVQPLRNAQFDVFLGPPPG